MAIVIQAKDAKKIPRAFKQALVSTINKTIAKGKTAASREVRKIYNIKAKDLSKAVKVVKAKFGKISGAHVVVGKRLRLYYFGAKQNKSGVSVRVRKDSGRKTITSAFIATMPSGLTNVFRRTTSKRLPIKSLTTVDEAGMYDKEGEKSFDKTVNREIYKIFEHELDYRLGKLQ